MRILIPALALAALATPAFAARPSQTPEEKLQKALAGRTAGEPVSCINLNRASRGGQTFDKTGIIYENGNTLYLNRFVGGCPQLRWDTMIVTRTPTSQLCRGDIADIRVNTMPGVQLGACTFDKFTPYTKPRK